MSANSQDLEYGGSADHLEIIFQSKGGKGVKIDVRNFLFPKFQISDCMKCDHSRV